MKKLILTVAIVMLAVASLSAKSLKLNADNIDRIIDNLTLEEKVDLIVGIRMYPDNETTPAHIREAMNTIPGAVGWLNPVPRLGIPTLVMSDGPAGCRLVPLKGYETRYSTHFPIETLLASTWDTDLVESVGSVIGNEAKEYGVDILLAPAINIHRHPLCGRTFEYFSEDPLLTGKMAAAYVNGVQSNGLGTSVKHFAVNSQETNRMNNNALVSPRALREIYLKGFEIAVKESDPWTIMTSYNRVNDKYTSQNPELLIDLLRDEWGYKGTVMTDWWAGDDAAEQVAAGNDMIEPGTPAQAARILEAVKNGTLDEKLLDRNIKHILTTLMRTPRFNNVKYSGKPDMEAHAAVTRQSATEGMVLLKNDNNALPLKTKEGKVALFGTTSYNFFSGGTGSGDVHRPYVVSLLDGLKNQNLTPDAKLQEMYTAYRAPQQQGVQRRGEEMAVSADDIRRAAQDNEVAIITIGRIQGEGGDRASSDFQLTPTERQLITDVTKIFGEVGKKTVVVLNIGGVLETMSWKDMPDAILLAWQAGQEGGNSVADILTGDANPSGKLPMTFPVSLSDHGSSLNYPVDQRIYRPEIVKVGLRDKIKNVDYTAYDEDVLVGYRWFDTKGIDVSYPFGYGLSYTTFDYGTPVATVNGDSITVSVDITNTGSMAGKEAVQLYVTAPQSRLDKPSHELKAFAKTAMLKPGEKQTVTMSMTPADLASFDESISAWVTDGGEYRMTVASSSRDPRGETTVTLSPLVRTVKPLLLKPTR